MIRTFALLTGLALISGQTQASTISSTVHPWIDHTGLILQAPLSQGPSLNPLSSSVNGTRNGVFASSSVSASWVDAGDFSVEIENTWNYSGITGSADTRFQAGFQLLFEYQFIPDAGTLSVQYDESKSGGNTMGAHDFRLRLENLTTTVVDNRFVAGMGTESFILSGGDTYAFKILDASNVATSGLSTLEFDHHGEFDLTAPITATAAVPEPSTLAFLSLGALGMAVAWRRRKKRPASAVREVARLS